MNLDNDFLLNENEEPGENLEETQAETQENEEPGENLEETQAETQENEEPVENLEETQAETQEQTIDYKQDFVMLENLTFIQVSLMGVLVFYFVLSLVVKFIKSFF